MSRIFSGMGQQVVLRTREMQLLEAEHNRPIDELLRALYVDDELNVDEIAIRLHLTKGTVSRWLAHFGIPTRRGRDRRVAI